MARDGVTLEPVADDDALRESRAAFAQVFGDSDGGAAAMDRARATAELDRMVTARHAGQVVGTAGNYTFDMSLPWATPAPCAGVTAVSVRADHRRQGLLRRMMHHVLDDAVQRGEPFSALWASEGAIYGRFGFGPAIPTRDYTIQRTEARFRVDGPVQDIDLVGLESAALRFPPIYERARELRHGTLSRHDAWWRHRVLADPPDRRDGAGQWRYAVLGDRGYAMYRLKSSWGSVGPDGTVEVQELVATDPEASAALWRFVIDTDLSVRTTADAQPVDGPLPLLFDDPLRVADGPAWPLYVRLVDVPAALTARGYRTDGTVVLEVHDATLPANTGRWRFQVADGVATCEVTTQDADVELDVSALATVSLGGVRVTSLAAAGRVRAYRAEAIGVLEQVLATDVAPWHGGMF